MSGSSKWISMSLAANSRTGKGADQRCGSPTEISPAPIHDEWHRQEAAALRECQLGHQVKGVKRVRSCNTTKPSCPATESMLRAPLTINVAMRIFLAIKAFSHHLYLDQFTYKLKSPEKIKS